MNEKKILPTTFFLRNAGETFGDVVDLRTFKIGVSMGKMPIKVVKGAEEKKISMKNAGKVVATTEIKKGYNGVTLKPVCLAVEDCIKPSGVMRLNEAYLELYSVPISEILKHHSVERSGCQECTFCSRINGSSVAVS
jgi:hypothetical protein